MKIRVASVLDLGEMVPEGIKFLKFIRPDKKTDSNMMYYLLHALVTKGVVFLAEKDEEIIGGIGGSVVNSHFWPDDVVLTEVFWWVKEEHRCSSAALRLMNKFIQYGKDNPEITQVVMSVEINSPLNDDVYTKRGFTLKEKSFLMEV